MAFIRNALAKRRPSHLHNAENPPKMSKGMVKQVTFDDLTKKDLSGESITTIYAYICEAMELTDPSPTFLTQVTSGLQCPPIDWYDFRHQQQLGVMKFAGGSQHSMSPFVEVEQDNVSNKEMSGALHPLDKLIPYDMDDSLVCRLQANMLFRYMPTKLVDKNGLGFFHLFYQPETAFAQMPADFVITVMGVQQAKQMRDEVLAMTNDETLLDMQMLRGLAFYGGRLQSSDDGWSSCPAVCMPEHIQRFHLSADIPSKVEEYWTYLSSRKKIWESADDEATFRSFQRDEMKAFMQNAKRGEGL